MLFERVAVERPYAGKGVWDRIPDPVGYQLADGEQLALASQMGYGTKAAYLGAVVNAAPAAQAAGDRSCWNYRRHLRKGVPLAGLRLAEALQPEALQLEVALLHQATSALEPKPQA